MSIIGSIVPAALAVNAISKLVRTDNSSGRMTTYSATEPMSLAERTIMARDTDGDGVLTRSEFMKADESTAARGEELFDRLDQDADGTLTVGEINAAIAQRRLRSQAIEHAHAMMQNSDANGDQLLSSMEVQMTEEVFERIDANHDGELNMKELFEANVDRLGS